MLCLNDPVHHVDDSLIDTQHVPDPSVGFDLFCQLRLFLREPRLVFIVDCPDVLLGELGLGASHGANRVMLSTSAMFLMRTEIPFTL